MRGTQRHTHISSILCMPTASSTTLLCVGSRAKGLIESFAKGHTLVVRVRDFRKQMHLQLARNHRVSYRFVHETNNLVIERLDYTRCYKARDTPVATTLQQEVVSPSET